MVADILTVAGALAAQMQDRPWVTLVPHVLPFGEPSFPVYSVGAVYPRTELGARLWRAVPAAVDVGRGAGPRAAERCPGAGRACRRSTTCRAGSRASCRSWPPSPSSSTRGRAAALGARDRAAAVGAALRRRGAAARRRPAGAGGAEHLAGPRAGADARGAGGPGGRAGAGAGHHQSPRAGRLRRVPPNARLVDWVSYARTMPRCDAVVCHAGHGTLARALASGVPVVACPRGRHGRERSPRALVGHGRVPAPPLPDARAACGWRCGGCWRTRATRARAGELGAWAGATTVRRGQPTRRGLAARQRGQGTAEVGLEPTTVALTGRRSA